MAGNFFEDLSNIAPNFLALLCILSSSLSIYFFPNLTIPAAIANLAVGVYFMFKGYTYSENNIDYKSASEYYKFVGWILTLSAIVLGLKIIFIGNKIIPKLSALVLGKKNMVNNTSAR
jgi:uncharacterized membrane protein